MLLFAHASASPAVAVDGWQEEILLQLSELRKAQGELKQQMTELRAELAALRAGKSGTSLSLDLRDPQLPATGSADAQLAIVEFSDFQCPYCRRARAEHVAAAAREISRRGPRAVFFRRLSAGIPFAGEPRRDRRRVRA